MRDEAPSARRPARWTVALVATGLVACGPSNTMAPGDAGTDAEPTAAPAPPAPPALVPCPTGWREVDGECDPWPEGGPRDDCADDAAHFAGTDGCERVGASCAPDGWPADLPTDRPVVYVDDDAAPGGDGSNRASAFRTITEARVAAADGAVVALAAGTYVEDRIELRAGQTLWGACPGRTFVTSHAPAGDAAAVHLSGASSGVRDLTIDAPDRIGLAVLAPDTTIDGVLVRAAHDFGVFVAAGSVVARSLVVRDMVADADGVYGIGVYAQDGASATFERAVVERVRDVGVWVQGAGTSVVARDLTVRAMRSTTAGERGVGIRADDGASVELERVVIDHARERSLFAQTTASVQATDLAILDSQPAENALGGRCVEVATGANVTLSRARLDRCRDEGVYVTGAGTRFDGSDVVVRDSLPNADDGAGGQSVHVSDGASARVHRALVHRSGANAVVVHDDGSALEIEDLVVLDTQGTPMSEGRGLVVALGGRASVDRARIEGAEEQGIFASMNATRLDARDVVVRGTRTRSANGFGRGVGVESGASVSLTRGLVEGSPEVGVIVGSGSSIELADVTVTDATGTASGEGGRGVEIQAGSTATLERVALARNLEFGLFVTGEGTSVTGSDLSITTTTGRRSDGYGGAALWVQLGARATLSGVTVDDARLVGIAALAGATVEVDGVSVRGVSPSSCAMTTCADHGGAFGIAAHYGASVTVRDFAIDDIDVCGVVVGMDLDGPTSLDLSSGVVSHAAVGACVQVPGYDTARLQGDVRYEDVGVPLQATSYPLPEPDLATP